MQKRSLILSHVENHLAKSYIHSSYNKILYIGRNADYTYLEASPFSNYIDKYLPKNKPSAILNSYVCTEYLNFV